MNKFAERLTESLKRNHISQTELAKRINMSPHNVSNYCSGKREPTLDSLILVCKVLDESADYLIGLKE